MPLLRTYDAGIGKVRVTLKSGYLDRLVRWSDIQEYMPFLHEQARSRPGCRVLELGARRGNSTLAFLAGCAESDGHVWSCDIADVRRLRDGIGPFAMSPRWTFVHGDDMNPGVQAAAARTGGRAVPRHVATSTSTPWPNCGPTCPGWRRAASPFSMTRT